MLPSQGQRGEQPGQPGPRDPPQATVCLQLPRHHLSLRSPRGFQLPAGEPPAPRAPNRLSPASGTSDGIGCSSL